MQNCLLLSRRTYIHTYIHTSRHSTALNVVLTDTGALARTRGISSEEERNTRRGIRFQRQERSFFSTTRTGMIDKRASPVVREERRVRFRLKGRREIPSTVVRYRWAISGRNARPGSVAELSKPWLTRRRIQRPRMIYRSRIGIISFSVSLLELGLP